MISRFFTRGLILGLLIIFGNWAYHITPDLTSVVQRQTTTQSITITPVIIAASRRDYPSIVENRGKGFIIGYSRKKNTLYTARHVISDTGYNYIINDTIPLTSLYHDHDDQGRASYHTGVSGNSFTYTTGLQQNQVLMAQYRNNQRSWLTGTIVSSSSGSIITDIPVQEGDSGSPVIFYTKKYGFVSKSHSGNNAYIQSVK